MTSTQKRIVLALTIVIALTRFAAIAASLWDWDEGLFTLAVSEYDVTQHRPHPPGYPLFIAAAKAVHQLGVPPFRSLQTVVMLGAIAIFPAACFLAIELGFGFATSVAAAAIFAFLPNVWIYSGTGFSDIPAIALAFLACALLLRGRRSPRAYILGAIVLALAIGIRPTNLLIGVVPGAIATWHVRRVSWRPVIIAAILGALIAGGSYAGAALASDSVAGFRDAVRTQSKWVHDVDAWTNPNRPSIRQLAPLFLITPVQHEDLMWPIAALAALSFVFAIVKRLKRSVILSEAKDLNLRYSSAEEVLRFAQDDGPLLTIAIFAPIAILSLLQLDFTCAGRYSIAYLALHAFLAADGLGILAFGRVRIHAALATLLVLVLAVWTWPALKVQRTTDSPPVIALKWILRNVPPDAPVYVHGGLGPHTDIYLADRAHSWFDDPQELAKVPGNAYVVQPWAQTRAINFERPHGRLWKIVRQRHFEASVLPVANTIIFGEGWYGEEGSGADAFRWMAKDGHIRLPALPGMGIVTMRFHIADDLPQPPRIDITFNGQLVETIVDTRGDVERSWVLLSRRWTPNDLHIVTSATAKPKDDDRELGLMMKSITWLPAKR